MLNETDYHYMGLALQLAEHGRCTSMPNPAVGCVLVNNGEIVGEGWHQAAGEPHAEINALAMAGNKARGATAYVTLEPCCHHGRTPPCTEAIIAAGILRVVVAMQDPNPKVAGNGLQALKSSGIKTESGLLQSQAEALNRGFCYRMRNARPYVRCKLAMSLDGRTAMASGESKWITSEPAREDVQQLRRCSSAIMTGSGTVLVDDPLLTVRAGDTQHQPLRVILDSRLRISADARLLSQPGRTLVFTTRHDAQAERLLEQAGAEVFHVDAVNSLVDLDAVLQELAQQEVNDVFLEAGATLSGAMMQAGLINELIIYMAPRLMGDAARGLFVLPGLDKMDQAIDLNIDDVRAVGPDWRITATIKTAS